MSSLFILVDIIVALSLSNLILNESLSLIEIVGAIILILAIILASVNSNKENGE